MNGAEVWLVVVKATFTINADGSTTLADRQQPVCLEPHFWGAPGKSSLRYEMDLVQIKQATDVLLHGHAYAPSGTPVPQVDVTLQVGTLEKTLRVFGRRIWRRGALGLKLSAPELFTTVPLIYEHAFGGVDEKASGAGRHVGERRNPIGTGFAIDPSDLADTLAYAVEEPASLITGPKDRPRPAGFGPIARDWSPRVELAGTFDQAWEEGRRPLLPLDFQERFYQCAPEDQQVRPFLRGGEEVELRNLTPGGVLRFVLPRVALGFETEIAGGVTAHRQSLHTVILEPDVPRVIMVWHTALPCHDTLYTLLSTRVLEKELLPRG